MKDSHRLLIDLLDADDVLAVGSKAFNLGRLARLGIDTPGGAVIPDHVFQQHLARAGALTAIDRMFGRLDCLEIHELESVSVDIRGRIAGTELVPELVGALADAQAARLPSESLVVRSSAVGEDSVGHSFAGQLDSFLRISSLAELEAAVRSTWCSLFSPRVLLYARHHGLRPTRMGVIVQRQIDPLVSGVLFTRDPTGRQAQAMLAEYCEGLGEDIVAGRITPNRLRIGRLDLELAYEYRSEGARALDEDAQQAIRRIARIGLRLEQQDGVPQDLEWCVTGRGQAIVVQARPAVPRMGPIETPKVHWTNANIAENFPDPVSAFLYSIVKPGYAAYFRNLGLAFGVSRARIDAMAPQLEGIVGLQGERLYYNLTNIHAVLWMMPVGQRLVEYFNLFVGARAIPSPPTVAIGAFSRVGEAVRIAVSIFWQYVFIGRRVRRFEDRVDAFARSTRPADLASKNAEALAADLRGFLRIRLEQWTDAALADTAAMVCYGLLKAQLARGLGSGDHAHLHNDLLKGLPGLASAQPVVELWAIACGIASDPALNAVFLNETPDDILGRLGTGQFGDFARAFADYLETWGFRSSGELMLSRPTPQEDPRPLLRLLQAYVRTEASSPQELSVIQQREREAVTARVAAELTPLAAWRRVPLVSRASRFRMLLAATQGAIKLRERARMKQALLYTRLRHIALNLGDRFVERGSIPTRDDIFLLTTHEVQELATGQATSVGLSALIESRRIALESATHEAPGDHLVLGPGQPWAAAGGTPPRNQTAVREPELQGSGACGGVAEGVAAVILDVAHADRLKAGQILVTRQTDPGWATVFFLARGLVIERGGMLSHGAIIAREYGIPAVVGVPDATRLIGDGDQIRVDGDRGVVELGPR